VRLAKEAETKALAAAMWQARDEPEISRGIAAIGDDFATAAAEERRKPGEFRAVGVEYGRPAGR
jgi:hypothetical protein